MPVTPLAVRFMNLRTELRNLLTKTYGLTVDTYFVTIGGLPLNLSFQNDDETMMIYYGLRSERHSMKNPKASDLALAIYNYVKMFEGRDARNEYKPDIRPTTAPKPRARFHMPASSAVAPEPATVDDYAMPRAEDGTWVTGKNAELLKNGGIVLSREQFLELKSRVVLKKSEYEELTYGYIPLQKRKEIDGFFSRLNKALSRI